MMDGGCVVNKLSLVLVLDFARHNLKMHVTHVYHVMYVVLMRHPTMGPCGAIVENGGWPTLGRMQKYARLDHMRRPM